MQIGCQEKEKPSLYHHLPLRLMMALSGPTQELVLTLTLKTCNSIKLDIRTGTA